jgi:4'-phosphopantetheinyl transferase
MGTSDMPTHAMTIGVAHCHLDDDRSIVLSDAWTLLSANEVARARRFHFDRDRNRYTRGRGFLRRMLGQVCGEDPADLTFETGAQGKPFLTGNSLAFNLSHSRDLAVLAVSQDGPLGIDLEFIDRKANIAGLAQTCLTTAEAAILTDLSEPEQAARFFAFWTAKEARMKLTGEGMLLAPQKIALDLRQGRPVGYLSPKTPVAQAVFLDLGQPGAMCCLAVAQGPRPTLSPLIAEQAHHVAV